MKDQVHRLLFAQAADVDPAFGRRSPHRGNIDAGAIVADRQDDLRPDLRCVKANYGLLRLAGSSSLLGYLDPVSD